MTEDFKLSSGTWVNVGQLRLKAIEALAPVAQDIAVTGHDRDEIGFLVFPNVAACRSLCADLPADAPVERVLTHANVHTKVAAGMEKLRREAGGSSTYGARMLVMSEPPSIDAGEITDKGYINQRAVLTRRQNLVAQLHATPCSSSVVQL